MDALARFLSPEYLVVADPGPLGRLWVLYLALGLLFAVGLAWALWTLLGSNRRAPTLSQRAWAWFEFWVCLAGLGTVAGRFLGWPGWSARIWPYSLAALGLMGILAYRSCHWRLPAWLTTQLHILALSPLPQCGCPARSTGMSKVWFGAGLCVHLAGIALVIRARYGWPLWAAVVILLVLLAPQAPLLMRRRLPQLMALTPLLGAYAVTILWLIYRAIDITIIGWQGLIFPDPLVSLFYVEGILLATLAHTVLCQLAITARHLERPAILWRGAVLALLAVTLAWAGIVYFTKRTHGATASDPYAYAQMGVDLAERGTFLHRFSLFEDVMPLQIAWAPLQPVGYHIPRNEQGDAPSVWATGASVLLAAGYGVLGEVGLYVTTPIVAILALGACWALVQETLQGEPKQVRLLTGAVAVALLATSPEHVDRLLVPMADAAAQLFTIVTLFSALRALHQLERSIVRPAGYRILGLGHKANGSLILAGVFFGWAYWVRHTQLVLALPVILAVLLGSRATGPAPDPLPEGDQRGRLFLTRTWKVIVLPLLVFCASALIAALPDIIYRWKVFGGLLATETTELPLMSLQHIGPVAWQMLRDALVAGEWGYLFPLAIYGGYRLVQDRPRGALLLGSAFATVLLVHLTYRSLRLRDLISIFPLVDLLVAYGAVSAVHRVRRMYAGSGWRSRLGTALLPATVIAVVVLSLAMARWAMVDRLWRPGWASFGYMTAEQRAAFDQLSELTPPDGIIGASLNAGAVIMYTDRDAVRPFDSWTGEEWAVFQAAMQAQGRPIYLLDDGSLMAKFIETEQGRHRLTPMAKLKVPIFYAQDRQTGWLYRLEWDQ